MKTIVINAPTVGDLKLFIDLSRRLGLASRILTDEEKEDIGLLKAMLEGRKTKLVSRASVMKKLTA